MVAGPYMALTVNSVTGTACAVPSALRVKSVRTSEPGLYLCSSHSTQITHVQKPMLVFTLSYKMYLQIHLHVFHTSYVRDTSQTKASLEKIQTNISKYSLWPLFSFKITFNLQVDQSCGH